VSRVDAQLDDVNLGAALQALGTPPEASTQDALHGYGSPALQPVHPPGQAATVDNAGDHVDRGGAPPIDAQHALSIHRDREGGEDVTTGQLPINDAATHPTMQFDVIHRMRIHATRGRINSRGNTREAGTTPRTPVDNDPMTVAPESLGTDVWSIDTMMGGYTGITSSYLIASSRPCLVETGTATSAPAVIEALTRLGVGPDDLATIVVTHIHLDHAGGVGDLARAFPSARIAVHESGARHLVDPSRLVASARRVFGPKMDELFGELLPTEATRLDIIGETGSVDLGDGRFLDAFHNPGHAKHHIGLVDSATGDLYTGDAAGVYVPETADVRPATPPPDFDLALALASLAAMRATQPTRLLFSHFGPVTNVADTLDESEAELHYWVEQVTEAFRGGLDLEHAVERVREKDRARHAAFYADPSRVESFEELSSTMAQVAGIWHWLERTTAQPGDPPPR
jgi:glyoxylase-like metal-dependent hydrolase (beta-lactamase superfamily II)